MVIVSKNIRVKCLIRTVPTLVAFEGEVFAIMRPKRQNVHGAS